MSPIYVSFIHILFTGPFLAYVGLTKPKSDWIYYLMAAIAVFAAIYLLYKLFGSPWQPDKIWYIAHLLLFIPLLLYISIYRSNMNPTFFSFLTAVGIGALGYHMVKLGRYLWVR
jgi:TctA family transporter